VQVKKALCVLIQHQLVTYQVQGNKQAVYRLDPNSVLLRIQFPCWVHAAKELFGDVGEFIVEDILQQGHTPLAEVRQEYSNVNSA